VANEDKFDNIKLKTFVLQRAPLRKVKRQLTEWENICPNHTSGLVSRTYKEHLQLNSKETTQLKVGKKAK
jgi:hypothetical protein